MSLEAVEQRVRSACDRAGRLRSDVTLVVVSKGQPLASILRLHEKGHRDFGENRAQELRDKVAELPPGVGADLRWHFVGPLQTNKVRMVRPVVVMLHSMDRESLAHDWLKGPGPTPPVFLQVNVGAEEQKSGVSTGEAPAICERMISLGLPVVGLMAIPPLADNAEESRTYFGRLRQLRDRIVEDHPTVTELSMGMTDDFEVAIEEGATSIRIGRAIFAD